MTTEKKPVAISLFFLTIAVALGIAALSACATSPGTQPGRGAESVLENDMTRGKADGYVGRPGEPEPKQTVTHDDTLTTGIKPAPESAPKEDVPKTDTPSDREKSLSEADEVNLRLAEVLREIGSFCAPVDRGSTAVPERRNATDVQVIAGKVFVQIYFEGEEKEVVARLKEIGADILMRMTTPKMVVARLDVGRLDDATGVEGVWFVDYGFDKYDAIKKGEMRGVDVEKAK
ncbi:MAG: hypothetical protein RDV41_09010 [Planctomycetota bacterium]|nr:hypothetical protein [Planctomycetota bacterium]